MAYPCHSDTALGVYPFPSYLITCRVADEVCIAIGETGCRIESPAPIPSLSTQDSENSKAEQYEVPLDVQDESEDNCDGLHVLSFPLPCSRPSPGGKITSTAGGRGAEGGEAVVEQHELRPGEDDGDDGVQ